MDGTSWNWFNWVRWKKYIVTFSYMYENENAQILLNEFLSRKLLARNIHINPILCEPFVTSRISYPSTTDKNFSKNATSKNFAFNDK